MELDWKLITPEDKENKRKYLENYIKWSSRCHDLHPKVISCPTNNVIWRYYFDQR